MMAPYILGLSIILHITAIFFVLRLIEITKRRLVFPFIAAATVILMALRQSITMYRLLAGGINTEPGIVDEFVALLIPILIVTGITTISKFFQTRLRSEEKLRRQLQELSVVQSVSSAGAECVQEDELIQRVTEIIGETFYPNHFGVLLLDEAGEVLRLHSSYRGVGEKEKQTIVPLGEGVTGRVAASGRSLRIPDVTQADEYINLTSETLSELAVPLNTGKRVLGVINAESIHGNAFTEDDERLLDTLANQLATAIEKVRLLETARRRTQELVALYETAISMGRALDTKQLLKQLYVQVKKLFAPDSFLVVTCDEQAKNLKVVMAVEEDEPLGEWENKYFPIKEGGLTAWVVKEGRPLLIRDMETDTLPAKPIHSAKPARSWLGVPLMNQNKVIGAVSVQSFRPCTFNENNRLLLENLAAHLTVTLENARLYEETHQAYLREKRLNELAKTVNNTLDFQKTLGNIVNLAVELVGADAGALALLSKDRDIISYPYLFNLPEQLSQRDSNKEEGVAWQIVETGEPVLLTEYGESANALPCWVEAGVHGFIGVPVVANEERIGVLGLYSMIPEAPTANEKKVEKDQGTPKEFTERELKLAESIGLQVGVAIKNARLFSEVRLKTEYLETIQRIDLAISSSLDLDLTLRIFLEQTTDQLGVDAADVLLFNTAMQTLEYKAGRGFRTDAFQGTTERIGEGQAGRVALERRTIHIPDLSLETVRFKRVKILQKEKFVVYIGVPLLAKGRLVGVLEVFHRSPFDPSEEWVDFLETLARQAAIAIDNSQLFESLQRSNVEMVMAYDSTLEGWAKALELRDQETEGHSHRVVDLSMKMAQLMGMNENELIQVRRGALLHDIGKMGIPDSILHNPGPFDDDEWEIMRKHPTYAQQRLSSIRFLQPALDIPYCHHEKWDGTGYPRGLKGEEIPLSARIFAIVDVWDALRSDRPYREAWPKEKIIAHLQEQAGKYFDPCVVDAFLEMLTDSNSDELDTG